MKEFYLNDKHGYPIFKVIFTKIEPHATSFTLTEINGWEDDIKKVPCMFEHYLEGTIKWDGCSHLDFGTDGYLHLCGVEDWKRHCAVMEWVYKLTGQLMPLDGDEEWKD